MIIQFQSGLRPPQIKLTQSEDQVDLLSDEYLLKTHLSSQALAMIAVQVLIKWVKINFQKKERKELVF